MTDDTDALPLTAAHALAVERLTLARAAARKIDDAVDALPDGVPTPDDLSAAVDAAADLVDECERAESEARSALYLSTEPCAYTLRDHDSGVTEEIIASSDKDARRQARAWAREGDWFSDGGRATVWVDVTVTDLLGQDERVTVQIDPPSPACHGEVDHEWCSPYSLLGGLEENPGVSGHGGGVVITEVCRHCGCYRVTDTWAQRPDTGEQGLRSIEYRDADEDSLTWVESQREDVEASA